LLSFARDGVPSSKRVPRWPAFDAAQPRVVQLGVEVKVQDWPNYATLGALAAPVAASAPAPSTRPRD
jgi:carboxylesterase type B